jgi:hypothetical protein
VANNRLLSAPTDIPSLDSMLNFSFGSMMTDSCNLDSILTVSLDSTATDSRSLDSMLNSPRGESVLLFSKNL